MRFNKKYIIIIIILFLFIFLYKLNSFHNNILIYESSTGEMFLFNGNKRVKLDIKNIQNTNVINNKYIVYNENNNLFLYNVRNKKEKNISKNFKTLVDYNNSYIIYSTNNYIYLYNLKNDRYKKFADVLDIKFSNNKKNIVYMNNNQLKIYSLSRKKNIISVKNVSQYECVDDSCKKFYFTRSGILNFYNRREKNLKVSIINVLWYEKSAIIYQTEKDGKYFLYYRKGNKTIKLDENKRIHEDLNVSGNKVSYLSGGNFIVVKKNGKARKILARNIERVVDIYNKKYLLFKNNTLYLNNDLLDENIIFDSIILKNNKIYYLQKHKDIDWLIERNKKNRIVLNKNVKKVVETEDSVYYLGDYNLYRRYGNVYSIKNNKRKLDLKINDIK